MIIETKKGAKLELIAKDGNVFAMHGVKNLGVVKEMANADLGWHLRAGDVAITVAENHVSAAKLYIAKTVSDHYRASRTAEQAQKDADVKAYCDGYAAVINASFGSR